MQESANDVALGSDSLDGQNVQTFVDAGRRGPGMAGAVETGASLALGLPGACLLHLICNFAHMLRISIYGRSDLLSYLYAASRAQVTFGPK